MARIQLENLSKSFEEGRVVRDFTLDVADGELMVLVGPSGCGKSTILRMLAGLEAADAGEIRIDGQRVNELEPKQRGTAMVFQNYALYPHMTVRRNIGFPLKMARVGARELRERVEETARLLGLSDYLERLPRTLSGGQMQRVALGRAIVRRPRAFLFDEPLSNLDAKMRLEMRGEIARLHATLGATMIYVTHEQSEAMTLGQRIAVLDKGELQQVGTPDELYRHPLTPFVAGFLGSPPMNFLDSARLPVEAGVDRRSGTVGIRPHDVVLAADAPLEVRVERLEYLGAEIHVHGRVGDQNLVVIAQERPGTDVVRVAFPPDRIHVFE